MKKNVYLKRTESIDKIMKFPSVKVSLHLILMPSKLRSALGGAALLTLGAQAQAETVDQAQERLAHLMTQTPEAIVAVIHSGEGCDGSILNSALETENYEPYEQCSLIEQTQNEVKLAQTREALASEDKTIAELTQGNKSLDDQHEQDETTIAVLTSENEKLIARNAELDKQILANFLE